MMGAPRGGCRGKERGKKGKWRMKSRGSSEREIREDSDIWREVRTGRGGK